MPTITQNISLDFSKEGVQAVVSGVKRGESNARELVFSFTNNGASVSLTGTETMILRCMRPNGTVFVSESTDFTIDGNEATFTVPSELTVYAGELTAEIEIAISSTVTYSPTFAVLVTDTTVSTSDTVVYTSEFPNLTAAIAAANAAKDTAEKNVIESAYIANGTLTFVKNNGTTFDVHWPTTNALGFYYKDVNVSGSTFTCTLLDKDGNEASLPIKGDFCGWDEAKQEFTAPDGVVNSYDVYYLAAHLSDPKAYPLKQAADFTGWDEENNDFTYDEVNDTYGVPDGMINVHDAEYLQSAMNDQQNYPIVDPLISCRAGHAWHSCGRITAQSGADITVTLTRTPPEWWDPSRHEYDASDIASSGVIWLPFGTGAGTVPITDEALVIGIENAELVTDDDEQHLVLSFTNGDRVDVGNVKGDKGDGGAPGNGISSITKTDTTGLVDTYTITFTSGATTTFTVTNGADGAPGLIQGVKVNGTELTPDANSKVNVNMVWDRLKLGDLTWTYNASKTLFLGSMVSEPLLSIYNKMTSGGGQSRTTLCHKYAWGSINSSDTISADKSFYIGNRLVKGVHIKDTTYTDAASFSSAIANEYIYYIAL